MLILGAQLTLNLPKVKDVDDDTFTLEVFYKDEAGLITATLPGFITFDSQKNLFEFNPDQEKYLGLYHLILNLTD